MPDLFYGQAIGLGVVVGMLAAKAWQLAFIMASSRDQSTQVRRYLSVTVGFAPSIVLIVFLTWRWGIGSTILGLSEIYQVSHIYGTALGALVFVHVMAFVGLPAFATWYHYHPSHLQMALRQL